MKLSKLTYAGKVYRGISGMALPDEFWKPNEYGVMGGIDGAFMSTTTNREVRPITNTNKIMLVDSVDRKFSPQVDGHIVRRRWRYLTQQAVARASSLPDPARHDRSRR